MSRPLPILLAAVSCWLAIGCQPVDRIRQFPDTADTADTADTGVDPSDYNLCGAPEGPRAEGSWAAPIEAPWLPLVDDGDTLTEAGDGIADLYDCATDKPEGGDEVVYAFTLSADGYFRAELDEDPNVDVDLHLLRADATLANGTVTGCLERHNNLIERDLVAGDYLLVVDTFTYADSSTLPGGYRVAIEAFAHGEWNHVPAAPGIGWSHLRSRSGGYGRQSIDVLTLDPSGFELQAIEHGGCETVRERAVSTGSLVAINTGFFGTGCSSLGFLRLDGTTTNTNSLHDPQRSLVWDDGGAVGWVWLGLGEDYTGHANGVGGYPSLVDGGVLDHVPTGTDGFFTSAHPRSALGRKSNGEILLVSVDGRSDHGAGMTLDEMSGLMIDLGAVEAMNLDGGGSTSLFVRDCSINGVVNHPSDNGGDGHGGSRSVSDGLYVMP